MRSRTRRGSLSREGRKWRHPTYNGFISKPPQTLPNTTMPMSLLRLCRSDADTIPVGEDKRLVAGGFHPVAWKLAPGFGSTVLVREPTRTAIRLNPARSQSFEISSLRFPVDAKREASLAAIPSNFEEQERLFFSLTVRTRFTSSKRGVSAPEGGRDG